MSVTAAVRRQRITGACFPTPPIILRCNAPGSQTVARDFAHAQAEAARKIHDVVTNELHGCKSSDERVAILTAAYAMAQSWRWQQAIRLSQPDGRYSRRHSEQFRTPVTDDTPNLFQIGDHERLRDGARWDPATHAYHGGADTPASRSMRQIAMLASARFVGVQGNVVINRVSLPSGVTAGGTRLLQGLAAREAALEMVHRIGTRGGDVSRIATNGDLIYVASAPQADRAAILEGAMTLLAQRFADERAALAAWLRAAYLLYQAPGMKRGSDATVRVFLIGVGTAILAEPPRLLPDIDLRAYVMKEHVFIAGLGRAQRRG